MLSLDCYEKLRDGKYNAPQYKSFLVTIPLRRQGPWEVHKIEVELDLSNLRMMRDGRGCYPGTYTQLVHKTRGTVMSDTTAEADDAIPFVRQAKGRVLIHGLGLGAVLQAVLAKTEVAHVDVVEIDADIIALVGDHYNCERLTIHHGDALTYKWPRGTRWNIVWHDIWDNICTDNLPTMKRLRRMFARRCDVQMCWAEGWCRRSPCCNGTPCFSRSKHVIGEATGSKLKLRVVAGRK